MKNVGDDAGLPNTRSPPLLFAMTFGVVSAVMRGGACDGTWAGWKSVVLVARGCVGVLVYWCIGVLVTMRLWAAV